MTLANIKCPRCDEQLFPRNEIKKWTSSYEDCLRSCDKCSIGFSNSKDSPTMIYKNYQDNIPELVRQNLDQALSNSVNEMNRKNKLNKFGFSTSEDALTWSFFNYFIVSNRYSDLRDLLSVKSDETFFDIYLWGSKINSANNDIEIIENFLEVSDSFKEIKSKRTEPDVVLKLGDKLIFIEVKYRSKNEITNDAYKFENYLIPDIDINKVISSGHYELYRNWAFASKLSNGNEFELINLGPEKLFHDMNKFKLSQFENALNQTNGKFRKLSWDKILEKVNNSHYEDWFKIYLNQKLKHTTKKSLVYALPPKS